MRNQIVFGLLCVILTVFVSARYTADKKADIEEVIREIQQAYKENIDDGDEALMKSYTCEDFCGDNTDCMKYCEDQESSLSDRGFFGNWILGHGLNCGLKILVGKQCKWPWEKKK